MGKRVVLVNPGTAKWAAIHPPINIGYIASYLELHGIETYIVDELAGQNVASSIKKLSPDFVGITATTPLAPDAYRVARLAREMGITTVMGGKHAMILPQEALKHVDIVVLGEGEKAMLDIVHGRTGPVVDGGFTRNIDDLPSPAWHLMDMEFYLNGARENHLRMFPKGCRMGVMLTMRGCHYNCIFCYNSWRDTPVRFNSAARVVADIETLIERYKANALFFMDDDMAANKKRFREICNLLIERDVKLPWGIQSSVNTVDRELLELGKRAGLIHVGLGCESGSQRILSILKKGRTTVEKNAQALRLCREVGVKSWATFMIGNPTETLEDIMMTFDFIKKTPIDGLGVLITTPYPGTELWKWCEERRLIPDNVDWSIFTTGRVSIPANDTIPPEQIEDLRNKIHFYFYPLDLLRALLDPARVLDALRHPAMALRKLWSLLPFRSLSHRERGKTDG